MKEVEVKAILGDKDAVERALVALGATFSEPVLQDDAVYVRETGSIETYLENTLFLRLRTTATGTLFTAKYNAHRKEQQLTGDFVATEHETSVASRAEMESILALLGFSQAVGVKKTRRTGSCKGYEVCIDEVEGLGSFIELERLADDSADTTRIHEEIPSSWERSASRLRIGS